MARAPSAEPSDAILRVEDVHKRFMSNGGEIEALRAVNLTVRCGCSLPIRAKKRCYWRTG
ncbi:MAG: hypothetical protein WB697_08285 [Stellaceae bacterium]